MMARIFFLILFGLAAAVHIDTHIGKKQKKAIGWVIVFSFCLLVQNFLSDYIPHTGENITILTTVSILGYSLRPAILILYIIIVSP